MAKTKTGAATRLSSGLKLRSASASNQKPDLADKQKENAVGQLKVATIKGKASIEGPQASDIAKWLTTAKVEDGQFWKELAETRRVALEETLAENEKLHDEMELVKAENEHLKSLADKGVEALEFLKTLGYDIVDEN